jgi:hypothetical protein
VKLKAGNPSNPRLSVEELFSKIALIRCVQAESFQQEISSLRKNGGVNKRSRLRQLAPFLDTDGLIRVGGRLKRSKIAVFVNHPIVLPPGRFATLLLEKLHHTNAHAGANQTVSYLRKRFWLLNAMSVTKKVIRHCVFCQKQNKAPCSQQMADLPQDRLDVEKPPFTNIGIDYFGLFEVKQGRSFVKRYGVIFTCLVSRAVHLDVAHSLTTDSFLAVFSRFVARRGRPTVVYSDNGTNLASGEKEMKKLLEDLNQSQIHAHLTQRQIQWNFLPPHASHMAGAWERLIGLTKRILSSLTNQQKLSDEALLTFIAEAERIMNDRPLTSSDEPGIHALTPAMLLTGRGNVHALPPGLFERRDQYTRRWWKQAQYMADVFWRRFITEYISTLQRRCKWTAKENNLAPDDLVLVADESTARGYWPLGRIQTVNVSEDQLVRSFVVRTTNGTKLRPITKIVRLETD